MSQKLISRSPDLQRLRAEGYDVEIRAGHLLVKQVPYLNAQKEVRRGTLVSVLALAGDVTTTPGDHVVKWAGEYPCRASGSPIETMRHESTRTALGTGLVIDHSFSNKPSTGRFENYYDKMTSYIHLISGPAASVDPTATAKVNCFTAAPEEEQVFNYLDTASSRAGIAALNHKLELGRVAIVGLGGVGSYILDLVAKTPVREIHLFDGDLFLQHNAFRSPGAASIEELAPKPLKVDYLAAQYTRMRRGIVAHDEYLEAAGLGALEGMDFVFLCLDRGTAKKDIIDKLLEWETPFIDAGMEVELRGEALGGMLRTTLVTPHKHDHAAGIPATDADANADYSRNIQIADLNALTAALAVIKWKKYCGFYQDFQGEHVTLYPIDSQALITQESA